MLGVSSFQTDGCLLGDGPVVVESLYRCLAAWIVVEVAIDIVAYQFGIVCIGIGSVAAALDIATDTGVDSYGTAAIYFSGYIVAAKDVVDVTSFHQYTG